MTKVSKDMLLISVIVPVYNVDKYLDKCIKSIINQTYKNLEIILVDDGSSDKCPKMCDDWAKKDNRIKVIHKKNGGVSSARNIGIKESKGEYITFVDSDDWLEKDFIIKLYEVIIKNDSDIALSAYKRVVGTNIEKINVCDNTYSINSKEYLIKALNPQTGYGFCHMKLISKNCLKNIFFNEQLKVTEDALFNIMLSKKINKVTFLGEALYNYRINTSSVVKKYDQEYPYKYLKGIKEIKEYLFKTYKDKEIKHNYYNFVVYHVMLVAVNYCYHQNNTTKNKNRLLKEICNINEFQEAIKKSNYKNISLTRKITLFTIKHKLYCITGLICKYRQRQNNN